MRVPESDLVGRIGLYETKADFARIGWGANENHHDFGTDLIVAVRDAQRNELGLLIGAQVKSGPSWFEEPTSEPDPPGWWFRSDQRHVDYWLNYNDAHLIILHDNDARVSYFEHINPQTIRPTGAQSKILVPAENRIDLAHLDVLLKIAGTGRAAVLLEGTAWSGATPPVPSDRLRFALIVPRLVAPHPSRGLAAPIAPDVAIAMLMQARLRELDRVSKTRSESKRQPKREIWLWELVDALRKRVLTE